MEAALKFVEEMANDTDRLRNIELGLIEAFLAGAITLEQYFEALEKLKPMMDEASESTEGVKEMIATFNSAVEQASVKISNNFADMLMDGKLSMDGLKDVFSGMVKQIIAKAFELMVVNRIMNSIFGSVTGFSPLPTMGFGAKAGGGSISSPTLVGERGPELFIPHSAGVVKNNMDTKNMLGGGGTINIYQTLNVETGVAQTVRAELANFAPIIKQDTIRAVAEARRRGGQFANAFGG